MPSNIEWTQDVANPVTGCTKVSPGCARCYAEKMSHRLQGMAIAGNDSLSQYLFSTDHRGKWTGHVQFHLDALKKFDRRSPTVFFVGSMSDIFQEEVTRGQIASTR